MQQERAASTLGLLGRVGLFFLLCAVALAAAGPMTPALPGTWPLVFVGGVTGLFALVLTFLFLRWEKLPARDVGIGFERSSLARFAVGLLLGLLLVALDAAIQAGVWHIRWERIPGVGVGSALVTLLGLVALACREELAFHGYPLFSLHRRFGLGFAQLAVALVFAFEHWLGGWTLSRAIFGAGVGSLVFGMAALASRGLALPIGIHAAFNFGTSMIGQNLAPGLWRVVTAPGQDAHVQTATTVSYVIVMLMALAGLYLLYRRSTADRSSASS